MSGTDNAAGTTSATALPAARVARGPGAAGRFGMTAAVLMIAAGAVGLHDALLAAGAVSGQQWIAPAIDAVNGTRPAGWLVPVGLAVAVAGLLLLVAALSPRPARGWSVTSDTGVYLRRDDAARLATHAAEDVSGVLGVRTHCSGRGRRTVHVRVRALATDPAEQQRLEQAVRTAVESRLQALTPTARVRVQISYEELR